VAAKQASSVVLSQGFASPVSRRVSEIAGVGLFALSLIWLIALASYDPNDAAWFFATGTNDVPSNFIGPVGAFLAELSFQVLGFASYMLPALVAAAGWHYFWCRTVDALYTKITGLLLLLGCASAMLSLLVGSATSGARTYEAGGFVGAVLASTLTAYLNRTGAAIVLITLLCLAAVLTTQVSFSTLFTQGVELAGAAGLAARGHVVAWLDERRRMKQQHDILAKHAAKDGAKDARRTAPRIIRRPRQTGRGGRRPGAPPPHASRRLRRRWPARGDRTAAGGEAAAAARAMPVATALPWPMPNRCRRRSRRARRCRGLLLARPRPVESTSASSWTRRGSRGEVPRVLGRRGGRADPSRAGRDHVRVQARCRREIQQGHRPRRRPVSGDEGRVRPHRSHSRQVHGGHPDPESQS
jgi:hypothetical protein